MGTKKAIIRVTYVGFRYDSDAIKKRIKKLNKRRKDKTIKFEVMEAIPLSSEPPKKLKPLYEGVAAGAPIINSMIFLCVELTNQLGVNAIYDILKFSLASVTKKAYKHKYDVNVTVVTVKSKTDSFEISINQDITDKQKDKLIDAVIKKFLQL